MRTVRVVVTAGYDRAPHVITLVELLRREGVQIEGLLVVSPFSVKRVRSLVRQRGPQFLKGAFLRLIGRSNSSKGERKESSLDILMQKHNIKASSLSTWAQNHSVSYRTVKSINDNKAVEFVEELKPDWVVYGGGGILHNTFISASRGRILNAHAGPLPEIRGMNACEWSILLGHRPAVTVHLINRGIDTGGVVSMHPFPVHDTDTINQIRSRSVATGVEALYQTLLDPPETVPLPADKAGASRQCYTMAPAIRELLELRLKQQGLSNGN